MRRRKRPILRYWLRALSRHIWEHRHAVHGLTVDGAVLVHLQSMAKVLHHPKFLIDVNSHLESCVAQQILGGNSSNDAAWQAVLDSLTAAAQYSLEAITDVLLGWRKNASAVVNKQDPADFQNALVNATVLRKRVRS